MLHKTGRQQCKTVLFTLWRVVALRAKLREQQRHSCVFIRCKNRPVEHDFVRAIDLRWIQASLTRRKFAAAHAFTDRRLFELRTLDFELWPSKKMAGRQGLQLRNNSGIGNTTATNRYSCFQEAHRYTCCCISKQKTLVKSYSPISTR